MFLGFRPYLRPINCVQHDLYFRQDLADLFCCSKPVPFGHCEVQDYQVGFQLHSFPDRLTPVYGVAADFPTRMRFEHRADSAQHRLVVISYEDAFRHGGSRCFGVYDAGLCSQYRIRGSLNYQSSLALVRVPAPEMLGCSATLGRAPDGQPGTGTARRAMKGKVTSLPTRSCTLVFGHTEILVC
jgi:hypothetical protein